MKTQVLFPLLVVLFFCFQSMVDAQGQRGQGVSRSALVMSDAVQKELELTDEQQEQLNEVRQSMRSARGQRRRPGGQGGEEGKRGEGKQGKGKRGEGKQGDRGQADGKRGKGKQGEDSRGQGRQRNRGGAQRGGASLEQVQKEIDQLSEILLDHQMTRLNEIYVQAMGARAIQDPVIAEELEITEDQVAEMQDLRREMREELMGLRDTLERDEIREKMMEMTKGLNEKMMGVLTNKQQKKLDEMKGETFEMPEGGLRGNRRGKNRTDF